MKQNHSIIKKSIIGLLIVITSFTFFSIISADEYGIINLRTERETNFYTKFASDLSKVWLDKTCGSYVAKDSGYFVISISCQQNFSEKDKDIFLDYIFKNGFVLKSEKSKKKSGLYLYKTEYPAHSKKYVFIKLFFRNAYLDSNIIGRVALYIQDLYTKKQLLHWQSLGIPLTYGVLPFREESSEVASKVRIYNQELWASITLESENYEKLSGKLLTVNDSLKEKNVRDFLTNVLNNLGQVRGISHRIGSKYTSNVYAMRVLFQEMKKKNILYYLDTWTTHKSSAFETAQIMSMKTYKRDYIIDHRPDMKTIKKNWKLFLSKVKMNGHGIAIFHAGNKNSYEFVRSVSRLNSKPQIKFVFISQMPYSQK